MSFLYKANRADGYRLSAPFAQRRPSMDVGLPRSYFPPVTCTRRAPIPMSNLDFHPTSTFAIWSDAFSPEELDRIEAYGDWLTAETATVFSDVPEGAVQGEIRITQR